MKTIHQLREEYRKVQPPEELRERIEALDGMLQRKRAPRHKAWAAGLGLAACLVLAICLWVSTPTHAKETIALLSGEQRISSDGIVLETEEVPYADAMSIFGDPESVFTEDATVDPTVDPEVRTCCVLRLRSEELAAVTVSGGSFLWYDEALHQVYLQGDEMSLQGEEDLWLLLPEDSSEIVLTVSAEQYTQTYRITRDSGGIYTAVLASEETTQEENNP